MNPYTDVLFEELTGKGGDVGLITLNRPQSLNALNHGMIVALYHQLTAWQSAKHIKAVMICAAPGRAFCAGGDLRLTYERCLINDPAKYIFFEDEYRLNRLIFHYPKPYIAYLNGINMGGGVGISIHGSHRIGTEQLLFAMPETGIGFYPDVGGTYFLPRLRGFLGRYLGLTGMRLKIDDCLALGLVHQKIHQACFPELLTAICNAPFRSNSTHEVTAIIDQFKLPGADKNILNHQAALDQCFAHSEIEDIMAALASVNDKVCQEALVLLQKKSPTSLKVTLKALIKGKVLNFDACMTQEFAITSHFLQNHDFMEGIRAIIIDKDQKPLWEPSKLSDVNEAMINAFFHQTLPA